MKESFQITENRMIYPIETSLSKTDNSLDGLYEYLVLCVDKDSNKFEARTRQIENIPYRDIDAKKCQLVKYKKEKNYLSFNPINFKFTKRHIDLYKNSEDRIVYKNKPDN